MSCLSIILGAAIGVFAGVFAGDYLGELTGSDGVAYMGGFISWCFCVWVGGNIGDGSFAKYIKNATGNKSFPPEDLVEMSARSISPASQPGQKVQLNYINSRGDHRIAFVDASTVHKHGDRVKVDRWGNAGTMNLVYERIKNPEVLGLISSNPVPETEPLPPVLEQEEDGPPILHPKPFILGNPSGPELLYVRRDGNRGVIYFEPTSIEIVGNRVNLNPKGIDKRYAIALDQIINPEILESHKKEEEEPPILGPQDTAIGDPSGKRLIHQRTDGRLGYIFFDPASVEIIGNRVNLKPKGIDKLYDIALDQIINPEVLTPEKEPEVIYDPPKPEPIAPTYEEGTLIILDEIPLDSFEAVQVMRRIKPELGPFGIFDALIDKRETLLQGYTENQAKDIQEDLQNAGCTVSLQTADNNGPVLVGAELKVKIETSRSSEPHRPWRPRKPQEHEFQRIRFADGNDVDEIKHFIESTPINVDARDESGSPLIFGISAPEIMGALIDLGADIHAINIGGNVIHHAACGFSSPEVLEMLIQFGVDFDAEDSTGQTPLICAAEHGEFEMAKILIKHGANIHHVHQLFDRTALQAAQFNRDKHDGSINQVGCEKIIKLLRKHGAD